VSLSELPIDTALVVRLRTVFERLRASELRLGEIFYARLFQSAPHLKSLFHNIPAVQAQKLVQSLDTVVQNLENPAKNAALLSELGRRHSSYGVKAEHYDLVIDLLVEVMQQLLGSDADGQHLDEWRMALRLISDQMIAGGVE
jgi:hemoglobin-like flavoprotein